MKAIFNRIAVLALALSHWTAPASAQQRSILALLPTEGRELPMEGEVEGTLSAADYASPNGTYLEAWSLTGETGQTVTIDLVSDAFDAMLYVTGPGLPESLYDDDSGGACHARITLTLLEPGSFHVVASSTTADTGTFRLITSARPTAPLDFACGQVDPAVLMDLPTEGTLEVGSAATGRLDFNSATVLDGRHLAAWEIQGEAGEGVTVTMSSGDFDSYLYAFGPGMPQLQTDDDSGGDVNAQLTVRFTQSGRYVIGASSLGAGSTGNYSLVVTAALGPESLPVQGTVEVPGSANGDLRASDAVLDGRRSQAWTFDATAGQPVTVELISADFDSYLTVMGPGLPDPLEDDDSAGDLDARIAFTPTESGTFRVIAASLGVDTGGFELRVR
ncbi:MAG: hypothetical protein HKN73_09690 [Gemmatimonadetes bacterium]|nr:hypothetical protein [Gemmatimonadota bacterium]